MNTLFSVILDAILVNLGTILAFLIRFGGVLPEFNFNAFKSIYLFMTLVNLTCIYIFELYTKRRKIFPLDIISRVSSAIVIASLISMAATYVFRDVASAFPTSVFLLSCVFNIIFVCGWRLLFNLSHQNKEERILMIGGDEEGKRLSRIINMGHLNRRIVKLLNKKEDKNNIIKTIDEFKITDVIIADSDFTHQEILDIILKCEERDVNFKMLPDIYAILVGKGRIEQLGNMFLVEVSREPNSGVVQNIKRIIDILISILILIITLPLSIGVILVIKLDSQGNVLYKQKRVGEKEKIFTIYKFRTMSANAEEKTGPVFAIKEDSRITRTGKILRQLHIDEIPQFFNVLKGNMSLVGPRPERPNFVEEFAKTVPGYLERFKIKPGITGLAQVIGGYDTSAKDKLRYDILYINNQSLLLDIKILFLTLRTVFKGESSFDK